MTELTDRLRTCVAHLATIEISEILTDDQMEAIIDARKLLVEAADVLEKGEPSDLYEALRRSLNEPVGEPMEIIKPSDAARVAPEKTVPHRPAAFDVPYEAAARWLDPGVPDLPTQPLSKNACPKCDSRATKTVHASKKGFRLECPVCGHAWKR